MLSDEIAARMIRMLGMTKSAAAKRCAKPLPEVPQ